MGEQIVLRCEDSLEGIFTALFDAFVCKNKMKAPYTDSISIAAGEGEMTLFAREIEVQTDAQNGAQTAETTDAANEDEETFFFLMMGGGLLIIIFAVVAAMSTVSSSIAVAANMDVDGE